MQVHASANLGSALKKPLLLLLVIAKIDRRELTENRIRFSQLRADLADLIERNGGRQTKSGAKPEQPFSHLRTSPFWTLVTQKEYALSETALVSDLMNPESFASLRQDVFDVLLSSRDARAEAFQRILQRWPETLHEELRARVGMLDLQFGRTPRNVQFTVEVLENYRYSCAFCGFNSLLNG